MSGGVVLGQFCAHQFLGQFQIQYDPVRPPVDFFHYVRQTTVPVTSTGVVCSGVVFFVFFFFVWFM